MRTRDRSGNRVGNRSGNRVGNRRGNRRGNPPRSRARLGIGAGVLAALLPLALLSFPTDLSGQTVRGVLSAAPTCLGAVAISSSAQEPPAPIELSGVGCADCTVRFEQVLRLGDESGPGDYSKLYDTMIEVIDVTNDRLVASQRVGPALRRFVGTRLASSFSTDERTGVEFLDLWRMSVIEGPRGGPGG